MTDQDISDFRADLQVQLKLYEDMIAINEEQNLMADVMRVEERARPLKDRWPNERAELAENARSEVDALIARLSETIKTLISLEDEAHKSLEAAMAKTKESLQRIQQKSQVNRAYAAYAGNTVQPR
ncbi:MAG: hypothetical protein L6Q71_04885, partial [Planctomycetes bacterium]|nr:hypothetical protein [Planctomycetota bacterium]